MFSTVRNLTQSLQKFKVFFLLSLSFYVFEVWNDQKYTVWPFVGVAHWVVLLSKKMRSKSVVEVSKYKGKSEYGEKGVEVLIYLSKFVWWYEWKKDLPLCYVTSKCDVRLITILALLLVACSFPVYI